LGDHRVFSCGSELFELSALSYSILGECDDALQNAGNSAFRDGAVRPWVASLLLTEDDLHRVGDLLGASLHFALAVVVW